MNRVATKNRYNNGNYVYSREGQPAQTVDRCVKAKGLSFIKNLRIKESFEKQGPSLKKKVPKEKPGFMFQNVKYQVGVLGGYGQPVTSQQPLQVCNPSLPYVRTMQHTAKHYKGTLPSQGLCSVHVINILLQVTKDTGLYYHYPGHFKLTEMKKKKQNSEKNRHTTVQGNNPRIKRKY